MHLFIKNLLLLSFVAASFALQAQGTLRGFVYDVDNGNPVMFATVFLEGTTIGTTTTMEGFYTFIDVPVGEYKVVCTYIGYDSAYAQVNVKNGRITEQNLDIAESATMLGTVQVTAESTEAKEDVRVSVVKLSTKQIKKMPGMGGEADLVQFLQVLPGVIFTGDQGGQLYIRGGAPIQNKILLDGMTIYNPFHSIGFFSVFETETIRNVDVHTGGFGAEFGGRVSAVVDITTKDGNKNRFSGLVSASPFQAKALLEGPIIKRKEGGGSTSFMITGKHSYIDKSSNFLYPYLKDSTVSKNSNLPYSYTDLYSKVSFNAKNGSKLNLFGFNFNDRVNYDNVANMGWNSWGVGASFNIVPPKSKLIIGGKVAYSDYKISLEEELSSTPRTSSINGFDVGLNFTYYGNNSELKYGFEINNFSTNFEFTNFLGYQIQQQQSASEFAGFAKYKYNLADKLIVEPSLRVHYYASLADVSIEPRLGVKYNAMEKLRFKLAGGIYSQNLISAVSEKDIVNLFVGFLSGPDEQLFYLNSGEQSNTKLQRAIHGIIGAEYDITKHLMVNVEPYYKYYPQLIDVNRNKINPSDPNYMTENGNAYGLDILFKYDHKNLFLWLAYSIGYVNRFDGEQVYPTHFDRRHNLNFVSSYKFGKASLWEASLRWNLGSGFPFTLTQGFYEYFDFQEGISTDYAGDNGDIGIIYSEERNSGRLPYYHRLDMSLKRVFNFGKHARLELILGATNVYNRKNIFYYDRVEYKRVNQLPILPSLSGTFVF